MQKNKSNKTTNEPGGFRAVQKNYSTALALAKRFQEGAVVLDAKRAYTLGGSLYTYLEVLKDLGLEDWSLRKAEEIGVDIEALRS